MDAQKPLNVPLYAAKARGPAQLGVWGVARQPGGGKNVAAKLIYEAVLGVRWGKVLWDPAGRDFQCLDYVGAS